jgi:hypothetical protein
MKLFKLLLISFICVLYSCKKKEEDTSLRIYHLTPDELIVNTDTIGVYGWFSKRRNDFFVVKNYNIKNENHKLQIDSFVHNYLKKDSFLIANKKVKWTMTFFKYGNAINEHTKHTYNTDYTIHNLFSYKKEICSYYFNTRFGYVGTNYAITSETFNDNKRSLILDYFNSNDALKEHIKSEQLPAFDVNNYTSDSLP